MIDRYTTPRSEIVVSDRRNFWEPFADDKTEKASRLRLGFKQSSRRPSKPVWHHWYYYLEQKAPSEHPLLPSRAGQGDGEMERSGRGRKRGEAAEMKVTEIGEETPTIKAKYA